MNEQFSLGPITGKLTTTTTSEIADFVGPNGKIAKLCAEFYSKFEALGVKLDSNWPVDAAGKRYNINLEKVHA
jgi:hypothetical protein